MSAARRGFWMVLAVDLIFVAAFARIIIVMMHRLMVGGPDLTFSGEYLRVILVVNGVALAVTAVLAGIGRRMVVQGKGRAGLIVAAVPAGVFATWFLYAGMR